MAADGHLNFDTKLDESGFKSGIGKLGSIAKGGLTVLGGAIAGVGSAFLYSIWRSPESRFGKLSRL